MGNGVGVPALRKHCHRDNASDFLPEASRPSDGVERLSQKVSVTDIVRLLASSQLILELELGNLILGKASEFVSQPFSRFQCAAVDKERPRLFKNFAGFNIAEQRQGSIALDNCAI